jgi:hypothetical protein
MQKHVVFWNSATQHRISGLKLRRWAMHVTRMVEERTAYEVLVGKHKGMKVLERCRRRREDIIKIEFKETGWYTVDRINLVDDRDK